MRFAGVGRGPGTAPDDLVRFRQGESAVFAGSDSDSLFQTRTRAITAGGAVAGVSYDFGVERWAPL